MRISGPLACAVLVFMSRAACAAPGDSTAQAPLKETRVVFTDVQRGIASGNISAFSAHLHSQVHITLRGGESGLYSANQAYYLLQNYFRERRPVSFVFTTYGDTDSTPYATGSAAFNARGSRQHVQIYVALAASGERWVITHINIY